MTTEEVVERLLSEEHVDLVRASLRFSLFRISVETGSAP
jgi:hypothetical protein